MRDSDEFKIDDLDLAIMMHFENDGRKSYSQIAEDLGVSVTTVGNRVKRLIDNKVIYFSGHLSPHKAGFKAYALVSIAIQPQQIEEAVAKIIEFPEVSWAALATGEFDLLIDVYCRDDAHLSELIINRISKVVGVRETHSTYLLRMIQIRQPSLAILRSNPQEKKTHQ